MCGFIITRGGTLRSGQGVDSAPTLPPGRHPRERKQKLCTESRTCKTSYGPNLGRIPVDRPELRQLKKASASSACHFARIALACLTSSPSSTTVSLPAHSLHAGGYCLMSSTSARHGFSFGLQRPGPKLWESTIQSNRTQDVIEQLLLLDLRFIEPEPFASTFSLQDLILPVDRPGQRA